METTQIKEAFESKKYKKVMEVFIVALFTIIVFAIGMQVGFIKAQFSYQHGESYYRSFGPDGGHPMGLVPGDVSDAHGVSGKIISTSTGTLIILAKDNTERTVRFDQTTDIRKLRDTITSSELANGDFIVIIGNPNSKAEIEAKFIRVLPPPPEENKFPVQ